MAEPVPRAPGPRPGRSWRALGLGVLVLVSVSASACAGGAKSPTTKAPITKSPSTPADGALPPTADQVVDVRFDTPGDKPRPIVETSVAVAEPVKRLRMNVTGISFRGLVCGFSFRAEPPASPVTIRMVGASPTSTFDSGALAVSWTALDADVVSAASGSSNGWNFSSEAHVNRNGPGWVVSLGGVTAEAPGAVPASARCELDLPVALGPANGPIGYWAGFATV